MHADESEAMEVLNQNRRRDYKADRFTLKIETKSKNTNLQKLIKTKTKQTVFAKCLAKSNHLLATVLILAQALALIKTSNDSNHFKK